MGDKKLEIPNVCVLFSTYDLCEVAIVADKLNLPEVAKSRPPLSIPGKLLVPRCACFCMHHYWQPRLSLMIAIFVLLQLDWWNSVCNAGTWRYCESYRNISSFLYMQYFLYYIQATTVPITYCNWMGGTDWIVPGLYTQQPLTRSMRNNCQGPLPSTGDNLLVFMVSTWTGETRLRREDTELPMLPEWHHLTCKSSQAFFPWIFSKAKRQTWDGSLGMRLGLFIPSRTGVQWVTLLEIGEVVFTNPSSLPSLQGPSWPAALFCNEVW